MKSKKCSTKSRTRPAKKKLNEGKQLILQFVGELHSKEYKSANKALETVIEHKLRERIARIA